MSLSMTLGVLQRGYRAAADKAVSGLGLSHAMAWPLVFISRLGGGLRQGVLADAMSIEGPSLVRSLDQLVEAGLVERREDALDRRAKTLHLTSAGERVCAEIEEALNTLRSTLYDGVDDADIQACQRVFDTLTHRLGITAPSVPGVPVQSASAVDSRPVSAKD